MNDQRTLQQIVEQSFNNAVANPTVARWRSCSLVAGCAAVRMSADGQHYVAAQLEGVAEEARQRAMDMMPREIAA